MPLRRSFGYNINTTHIGMFVLALLIAVCITDILSWLIHKSLHTIPFLWKNVHYKHHIHIAPVAAISLDAHPFESIVWDLFPFMTGLLILGTTPNVTLIYGFLAFSAVLISHCGYYSVYLCDASFHDLHHERMKCNYGIDIFMDKIMNTYILREKDVIYPKWNETHKSLNNSKNIRCPMYDAK